MKLTMKRKGKFQCNWINTDGKCGIGPDTRPIYAYECLIETADILDKNGFIMDQLDIDKYFQKKYAGTWGPYNESEMPVKAKSCEQIALDAVKDVKFMLESHMLKTNGMSVIYRISVTISFNNDAMMTAEWTPESAKQIANVKKRKPIRLAVDMETRSRSPWPSPETIANVVWNRTRRLP